ncbi:hypothetical protein BGW39_008271 [Mortierella sp. 14UC]|nr:hypothetical protein BGW39_008271 [Mortierella sp. 14UC]
MDSLSVVISSPTHAPHKFTLNLSRQCSILELKELIVTRLDIKLTTADQRLIFGGRILDDKETLDRVFDKVDCSSISPTIHLVVSHRQEPGQTQRQTPQHSTTPTTPAPLRFRGNSENTPAAPASNNTAATSGTNLNNSAFTPFTSSTTTATSAGAHDVRAETNASNSTTHTAAFSAFPSSVGGVPLMVPMAPQAMQYVLVNNNNPIADQVRAGAAVAADTPQQNAQEIAARDQRRAASLWLLMKLAFGIYLFGQNGSIERIVLLHIAALVIFLHQTGRLRIVRRIVPTPPAEDAGQGTANAATGATATPQPTPQTTTSTTTTTTTSTSTSSSAEDGATATTSSSSHTQHTTSSTSESSMTQQQQQQQGGDVQAQAQESQATAGVQPRVSPWRSLEHALLTFVTSLVPAPQPDIDPAVAAAAAAGERGM